MGEQAHASFWFLESLDQFNQSIHKTNDLEQMLTEALDTLLLIFNCDRAWLVYPCDPDSPTWQVPMERTRPEYPGVLPVGVELPLDPVGAAVYRILRNSSSPVQFGPGSIHPVPIEMAQGFHVQSFIAMAFYPKVDKPWAFGLHQCSHPRVWTVEEERLFQEFGRRLSDALTSVLVYRALQESESKLEEAQHIAHVGYWDYSLDADRMMWSDETYRIFGMELSEPPLSQASMQERIHPDERQKVAQIVADMLAGNRHYDVEYRIILPNGATRFVQSQGDVTRDESGKPRRMFGTIQDVSERKQNEAALRRQNEYLTALHETSLAIMNHLNSEDLLNDILSRAVALVDTEFGSIYLLSPDKTEFSVAIYAGYPKDLSVRRSTKGKGLSGLVWQTEQTIVVNDYQNWHNRTPGVVSDMVHANIGIPLKSNNELIGVLTVDFHEKGRTFSESDVDILTRFAELASIALDNARLYGTAQQELAERKRAEEELRRLNLELEERVHERTAELNRERALLKTILDSMGEGLIYLEDDRINYVNNAMASLAGYEVEELLGTINTLLMTDRGEDKARILRGESLEPGTIWRGDAKFRRKDGSEFDAALTTTVIGEEKPQGVVTLVRDVTAEKQLQAQKARFISNASHELRTPITNFKTRLYLLRKQPEQIETHVGVLEQVANQMASLVEDLLDLSRFERGVVSLEREDVVLQKLIHEAVKLQEPEAEHKHIHLSCELPTEPVHIGVDPKRIRQVLNNLITNGINYTPENGRVGVELCLDTDEQGICAAIHVSDSGIGIAPEHLPRLCEPFFRVNERGVRGTGLGLSISKEIVELHGGQFEVESKLGEGSTFHVRLPLR